MDIKPELSYKPKHIKAAAATGNKNKIREFKEIFEELGINAELYSAKQLGMDSFPPENADTFKGNASIKAEALYNYLLNNGYNDFAVIADDSGITVDALGGAPGVYSARFAGENADDEENLQKLLCELEKTGDKERKAQYVCIIAAITAKGERLFAEGRMDGRIVGEKAGEGGFGYDPIFFTPVYNLTVAQLTPEQKNAISHRGSAVREICAKLALAEGLN